MRIGIDARALSGRFTGDRTYWRGLIGGLAAIDTENKYVLYTRQSVEGDTPLLGPNFQWRQIPRPANDALWMLQAFPRALSEDGIDVAHTQYNIPLLGAPCPFVTTVHDVSFALFPELFLPRDRWILNTFVPRSMAKAAKVVADSESTRRDIFASLQIAYTAGKSGDDIAGRRLAVPTAAKRQESAWETVNTKISLERQPYILSVGVLQPRKNLGILLDAFALVKLGPHKPPHKLVIVGKRGWLGEELDRQVAELPPEVTRDVIWAGYVADDDLPVLYGGADAFCYPSRYEGFGLPPLEAMACGCPVLCVRASSIPEVVGDAAVLLPPDDSGAWAAALEKLLTQPQVRERWRERGLERAGHFSWKQTAQETLRIYKECL